MSTRWWWRGKWLFFKREMKIIEFIHVHVSAKKCDLIRLYGSSGPATGEELTQRVKQNLTRTKGKWHTIKYVSERLVDFGLTVCLKEKGGLWVKPVDAIDIWFSCETQTQKNDTQSMQSLCNIARYAK